MVDFLLQDGVCETLMSFITQNGSEPVQRNMTNDQSGIEMKLAYRFPFLDLIKCFSSSSYRAVLLLSPEIITEPLNAFLSRKAAIIAQSLFNVTFFIDYLDFRLLSIVDFC
jgi:hypothetical protein